MLDIFNFIAETTATIFLIVVSCFIVVRLFEKACIFFDNRNGQKECRKGIAISSSGMRRMNNVERVELKFYDGNSLVVNAEDGLTLCVATLADTCVITLSDGRFLAYSDKPVCERSITTAADKHVLGPLVSE